MDSTYYTLIGLWAFILFFWWLGIFPLATDPQGIADEPLGVQADRDTGSFSDFAGTR